MSKVLSRAQFYIQLEESMKNFFNHIAKHGHVGEKLKSLYEASAPSQDGNWGNLPLRSLCSLSFHQIRPELTIWWNNILLHCSSPSTMFSTSSRTSHKLGARDQSGMIPHFSEQNNIALIMTARDIRPSIARPSGSTKKSSSNKVRSKSTSSLPK